MKEPNVFIKTYIGYINETQIINSFQLEATKHNKGALVWSHKYSPLKTICVTSGNSACKAARLYQLQFQWSVPRPFPKLPPPSPPHHFYTSYQLDLEMYSYIFADCFQVCMQHSIQFIVCNGKLLIYILCNNKIF